MDICINDLRIKQDEFGRYRINDLYKSAVTAGVNVHAKKPHEFLRSSNTREQIKVLKNIYNSQKINSLIPCSSSEAGNLRIAFEPVFTYKGGKDLTKQGTYICRELVYSYAMWLSPSFHVYVVRAFDYLITNNLNLYQQYLQAKHQFTNGKHKASIHGKGLARWRKAKNYLVSKINLLEQNIQPQLLFMEF